MRRCGARHAAGWARVYCRSGRRRRPIRRGEKVPKRRSWRGLLTLGVLLVALILIVSYRTGRGPFARFLFEQRLDDRVGLVPPGDEIQYEKYLNYIENETGIDIRLLLVRGTGRQSLEEFADEAAQRLNIGRANGQLRGLLLVYDAESGNLRVELGYGMEQYFPDSFVGYLLEQHAAFFFNSSNPSLGIRLMLRIMHERIRDQMLGGTFDARLFRDRSAAAYVSGGAGASAAVRSSESAASVERMMQDFRKPLSPERKRYFSAQPDPATAYQRYIEWLSAESFDPQVGLLTRETRAFLTALPLSPAYRDHILMHIYGRQYRIAQRGRLALLYFVDTPLTSPMFLRRGRTGWHIDITAEVRNSMELVGQRLTWAIRNSGDEYMRAFANEFSVIDGKMRVRDGDNRQLPLYNSGK